MRDQRLISVQFQLEFLAQEHRQLVFDLLGFSFRSGETQDVIIGLCRAPDYADRAAGPGMCKSFHAGVVVIIYA
jgi:hypothetical protein